MKATKAVLPFATARFDYRLCPLTVTVLGLEVPLMLLAFVDQVIK